MKKTKNMYFENTHNAYELFLYCDNCYRLYTYIKSVILMLAKKEIKGIFDDDKAIEAFYYVTTQGALFYQEEHSYFNHVFNVTERWSAAQMLKDRYHDDIIDLAKSMIKEKELKKNGK